MTHSASYTRKSNLGARGETLARQLLEAKGYRFVESNWRAASGEIDLVMLDGEQLVFVEVKTRKSEIAGSAEESVSLAKARKLLLTGEWYVSEHPESTDRFWRIDLVAITLDQSGELIRSTHLPDAITL